MGRRILNAKGATFVEVIVAIGLTGVVSLGVMNLTQSSNSQKIVAKQNLLMDDYIRVLRDYVSDKANCDATLSASGGGIAVDLSRFNQDMPMEMDGKINVRNTRVLLPNRGNGREVLPISLFVEFNRGLDDNSRAYPVKKTSANVVFVDGAFTECSDYESEAERSAFKLACESIGGTEVIDAGDNSQTCDFSNIDPSHDFIVNTKNKICTQIYNGSFNNGTGKCDSLSMPTTPFIGSNINASSFRLGNAANQRVETFQQVCAGENNFMIGIARNGTPVCRTVQRCTRGDAACP